MTTSKEAIQKNKRKSFFSKPKKKPDNASKSSAEPKTKPKKVKSKPKIGQVWVLGDGRMYFRKPKFLIEAEKQAKRQLEIVNQCGVKESDRKIIPLSTKRKNGRPRCFDRILESINCNCYFCCHCDPVLEYCSKKNDRVRSSNDQVPPNTIINVEPRPEKKSVLQSHPGNQASSSKSSTITQPILDVSGKNATGLKSNTAKPSTTVAPNKLIITTKSKKRKQQRRVIPTEEFFRGTIFHSMFSANEFNYSVGESHNSIEASYSRKIDADGKVTFLKDDSSPQFDSIWQL